MPSKREVVWQLKRHELQDLARRHDVEIRGDARTIDDLVDSIVRARRLPLHVILEDLSRDRLKELCRILELDDSGREKIGLIERLAEVQFVEDDEEDTAEPSPPDEAEDAGASLKRLLGASFEQRASGGASWPLLGTLNVGGLRLDVAIYVRNVVSSHRDELERRIQNPGAGRSISNHPGHHTLLLGVWREHGDDAAVIIAFDPEDRVGRTTRYSAFFPLSLAEKAADTGFASHVSTKSERIYAFRPENLGRYLRVRMEDGDLRESELVPQAAASSFIAVPRTKTAPDRIDPTTEGILNIRPKVAMYAAFARLNYKPWFAIAEFLDNSIQSFLSNRARLRAAGVDGPLQIDVTIDDAEISVSDRAGGIALKDFARAFSPAHPPDDASGLSEFGLGMKAAATWFGRIWSVRTSALGDPHEREVVFDIPSISRDGIEELSVTTRATKESDHFTVVTMRDLRVRPKSSTLAKIKSHLTSIYRVLLEDGTVAIRVTTAAGSQELRYEPPTFLEAPFYRTPDRPPVKWWREFAFELDGRAIKGWAGILKAGNQERAGFSVFRRGRLIEGSGDETYKPRLIFKSGNSFMSQRIIGELHVDGFNVSHTKDGIQWDEYEERVVERLYAELSTPDLPLIDQAKGYRVRKTADLLPKSFAAEALEGAMIDLQAVPPASGQVGAPIAEAPEPASAPPVMQQRTFDLSLERDGVPWRIHLELVRDRAMDFFTVTGTSSPTAEEVTVRINLDHDFSIAWLNDNENAMHPMVRFIAALAMGERVARLSTKGAGSVRLNTNEWLRKMAREKEQS